MSVSNSFWQSICLGPQSFVVDFVSPFNIHDSPVASVYLGLYLICLHVDNDQDRQLGLLYGCFRDQENLIS